VVSDADEREPAAVEAPLRRTGKDARQAVSPN
jgi:hypothetical protein